MKLKSILALLAISGIIGVSIYSCQKEMTSKQKPAAINCANYKDVAGEGTIQPCEEPSVFPLYAGNPKNNPEDKKIGSIKVFRDANYLYVQYSVTKAGWSLGTTHTFAGPCDEVPSNNGGAIPGQFDKTPWGVKSEQSGCGVTCWVEKFPIEKFNGLDCICILTHGEALKDCEAAETAWGGNEDFPGNNWSLYVNCFKITACEEHND